MLKLPEPRPLKRSRQLRRKWYTQLQQLPDAAMCGLPRYITLVEPGISTTPLVTRPTLTGNASMFSRVCHYSSRDILRLPDITNWAIRRCNTLRHLHLCRATYNRMVHRRLHTPFQQLWQLPDVLLLSRRCLSIHLSSKALRHLHFPNRLNICHLSTRPVMGEKRHSGERRACSALFRRKDIHILFSLVLLDGELLPGHVDVGWRNCTN